MIHLLILIVVLGLFAYLASLLPIPPVFKQLITVVLVLIAIVGVLDAFAFTHLLPHRLNLR